MIYLLAVHLPDEPFVWAEVYTEDTRHIGESHAAEASMIPDATVEFVPLGVPA